MDLDLDQLAPGQDEELRQRIGTQLQDLRDAEHALNKLKVNYVVLKSTARKRRTQLELDVARSRSVFAPIWRVPTEILLAIFKETVRSRPMKVKNLLLVCRHWNTIVMNGPSLWTNAQLFFGGIFLSKTCKSLYKYAKACFQRSQGLLIQVTLDFKRFPDRLSYIEKRLGKVYPEGETNEEALRQFKSTVQCAQYSKLLKRCLKVVSLVASHRQQWGSLTVIFGRFHKKSFVPLVIPLLDGAAPKLHSLITEKCSSGKKHFFLQQSPLTSVAIQDARYLEGLTQPSLLQVLEIPVRKVRDLQHLRPLSQLQSLTLNFSYFEDEDLTALTPLAGPHGNYTPQKISLPSLHSISWLGGVPTVVFDIFETPAVRDLRLFWDGIADFTGLPHVSPINLYWEVRNSAVPKVSFLPQIEAIFNKYSDLQTITMPKCHSTEALTVLGDLREQCQGLKKLEYIVFIKRMWEDDWSVWGLRQKPRRKDILVVQTPLGRTREDLLAVVTGKNDDNFGVLSPVPKSTDTSFTSASSTSSHDQRSDTSGSDSD
jgi:hypothetical protein